MKMSKCISAVLGLSIFVLGGCGASTDKKQAVEPAASNQSAPQLQKVSVMLDWYPNAVHSLFYVAEAKGYFKEQGLEVDIQMPADTNDPLKLVAAGQVDLALSYEPQVIVARSEGIPVKSVAAIVRHPLNALMVPSNMAIQTPKDLVGKTIGYPSIPLDEAIIQTMIKAAGGDPQNVKMVDVGFDLIPAIATKKTDAIIGGYINHEQLILEKEGHPVKAFSPTEYGVPDYYELVLVAGDKGIQEKSDVYKKFKAALVKGQAFVQENPTEGLNALFEHEEKSYPLDKEIEKKSLDVLLPLMDAKDKTFGHQEEKSWDEVSKWLLDNKVIQNPVQANDVFVNL